jgi:hypothetical protein
LLTKIFIGLTHEGRAKGIKKEELLKMNEMGAKNDKLNI